MKHLTLLTLLVFSAPFGWGENEDVWHCVDEKKWFLGPLLEDGGLKLVKLKPMKFTLKYEPEKNRLAIQGPSWAADGGTYYLDCVFCYLDPLQGAILKAQDHSINLALRNSRFYLSETGDRHASLASGTCTKF